MANCVQNIRAIKIW